MRWSLLDGIPAAERRRVLAAATRRRFARRETLFHEGDPGETLHLIDSGTVAVRITTPRGDIATVVVLGAGQVVGELALLDRPAARAATAVALEPTQTLALHRDDFEALRQRHPSVDAFLIAVLTDEVRRLSNLLVEALYLPVDIRVMRRLLGVAEVYGAGGRGTRIPLTQHDLATLAGTSRATVNRVLGDLEGAGLVKVERARITVLDGEGLARRAR